MDLTFSKHSIFDRLHTSELYYQIYPTPTLPAPILWIWCLIFAGPKRNYGKPKVEIVDNMSNFKVKTSHEMQQAVHGPTNSHN